MSNPFNSSCKLRKTGILFFMVCYLIIPLRSHAEYTKDSFVSSKIAIVKDGIHSTTRGTIRLVFVNQGRWLVFHGKPNVYQFSNNGINWTAPRETQNGRNNFIEGDTIYSFYQFRIEKGKWVKRVSKGTIFPDHIKWGTPKDLDIKLAYYPDIRKDSEGYFTVSGRTVISKDDDWFRKNFSWLFKKSQKSKRPPMIIEWVRSKYPNNFMEWELPVQCIKHVDITNGSVVHENIALEEGQSYVIGQVSVDGVGKLYGNWFDGQRWQNEDVELATGMSTIAGDDKRMSAEYDPIGKKIIVVYVDAKSRLWYRTGNLPFGPGNWSKPLLLKNFPVFTAVLSLDLSSDPVKIFLVYGKTIFEHKDKRWQSGELYLQSFDGKSWTNPILVSEPETKYNWYPNMNEDVSKNIGIMYLKGMTKNQETVKSTMFDIMFFSTGKPK